MSEAVVFEDFSAELDGREVLSRVSFSVANGEVTAIFGRSGSGKSLVMRALCGLLPGSSGNVRVLGRPVVTLQQGLTRSAIVGFQSPSYAPELTVQENLELQASLWRVPRRKRAGRIAFLVQLLGLESLQRTRAARLSDGWKATMEIARALLPETSVVAVDSLMDCLDPDVRNRLFRHIFDAARKENRSFLIASACSDIAEICDRVVLMDKGSILATGTPEELRAGAPDEVSVVQTVDNPALRRRISERFNVVVQEEGGSLRFSAPQGDILAADILSECDSQVTCVRVRRQTLHEITDALAAGKRGAQ